MAGEIRVVWENDNLMVVEKPAGMVTTKERKEENTLEDYLRLNYRNKLKRNGIVHRLDKGTSGMVLVAKNQNSFDDFKKQFKNRTVVKKYYCLVSGEVSLDGSINLPIGRSKYGFGKFGVVVEGKPSLTEFRLIKRYIKDGKKYSFLEVNLKTGRTHQIRVHLSHLRWPLVGDKQYGGEVGVLNRPFLHASHMEIDEPKTGKRLVFDSDISSELEEHLSLYEER